MNQAIRRLPAAALLLSSELTDGQLLARFLAGREEVAFEALVRRHAPMVLGVCRRVLGHADDAEDAFQATFLVLVRKAGSLVSRATVGAWLHGVAYHTALKARAAAAKRRAKERQAGEMTRHALPGEDVYRDWLPLLDRELSRLPDKYRAPVVLCDLEGKTRREAARLLHCKEGTLSGRLARARKILARRLTPHGLPAAAGALGAALAGTTASACVPAPLVASTVKAAALVAAGQAVAAGVVSAEAAALTQGVLKAMLFSKLKTTAAVLFVIAATGLGTGQAALWTRSAELAVAAADAPGHAEMAQPPDRAGPGTPPAEGRQEPAKELPASPPQSPSRTAAAVREEVPPAPPAFGSDHLAALHQHLREIHRPFPHLAHLFASFGPPAPGNRQGTRAGARADIGSKVPEFSVTGLDGKRRRLTDLQAGAEPTEKRPVVLMFWCSFCGSCRRVEHSLDQLAKKYQGKAAVVALDASAGETAEKVTAFAKKHGLTLPIVLDGTGRTADLFGTEVTTTTAVIDREGVLRYLGQFGTEKQPYAEEALQAVLAGQEVRVKTTPHDG
jgi:RNA polymerase sigma factor (sigma-70 family)